MQTLGVVEDTLFVPMLGRIYASEHYPQILYDKKALELKKKLPSDLIKQNMQSQYTLLASASRSANMDRIIRQSRITLPSVPSFYSCPGDCICNFSHLQITPALYL